MDVNHKLYDKGKKVEVLEEIGLVVSPDGRTYKIVRERVSAGIEYISLKLYNEANHFIKRFMIDQDVAGAIGEILVKQHVGELPRGQCTLPHLNNRIGRAGCASEAGRSKVDHPVPHPRQRPRP